MAKSDEDTNQRLQENREIHGSFSHLNPVQSSVDMNAHFKIIEQLSDGGAAKARVYLATKSTGEKCVLKIQTLDIAERKHVTRAFRKNSRRGLQGDHRFLRYSCWTELNLLRNTRQILLQQASPCFPFLYSSYFVETIDNVVFPPLQNTKEPQLVYCIEYLSRITLRKWLHSEIIESRLWQTNTADAILRLKRQFYILFFHIFAALGVLHSMGEFLHNDLHLDNVLMVQSKQRCSKFVYQINRQFYIVPNALGEFLCQIPVICDFGTASDAAELQNVSFREHFRETHRCAFHRARCLDEKCNQTVFCDVLRILQDTFDELRAQKNARELEQAFQPFNAVRERLLKQFENQCSDNLTFIFTLVESLYSHSDMPQSDFLLFDCDKIVGNK